MEHSDPRISARLKVFLNDLREARKEKQDDSSKTQAPSTERVEDSLEGESPLLDQTAVHNEAEGGEDTTVNDVISFFRDNKIPPGVVNHNNSLTAPIEIKPISQPESSNTTPNSDEDIDTIIQNLKKRLGLVPHVQHEEENVEELSSLQLGDDSVLCMLYKRRALYKKWIVQVRAMSIYSRVPG